MKINSDIVRLSNKLKMELTHFNELHEQLDIDASIYRMKAIETEITSVIRKEKAKKELLPTTQKSKTLKQIITDKLYSIAGC